MPLFIEIERSGDQYTRKLRLAGEPDAFESREARLGRSATVEIKQSSYDLGWLVSALVGYRRDDLDRVYDAKGQLQLGRFLNEQLLGGLNPATRKGLAGEIADLRIVTCDEHAARLPWALLANENGFLSTSGVCVSLARALPACDCELPPSPRILVVAPEPPDKKETYAEAHLAALEERLSSADRQLRRGRQITVVESWSEFRQQVKTSRFDALYFYGHGEGDVDASYLVFRSDDPYRHERVLMADVADVLRNAAGGPPLVAYVNCCRGDSGGLLGAGWQLGSFVPAVITNATVATVEAAQAQGVAVWTSLLVDGAPPHRAVGEIRTKLAGLKLSFGDVQWMTPVLHCSYGAWKANPPEPNAAVDLDPHWRIKIDRVNQFAQISFRVRTMLRERKPQAWTYVWYGQPGQGVEIFHDRLRAELKTEVVDTHVVEVTPEWPIELDDPDRSFDDMLVEAFSINSLKQLQAHLRTASRGAPGRRTLVYFRHRSFERVRPPTLAAVKDYIRWWDRTVAPLLDGSVFALIGISFVVTKPDPFRDSMLAEPSLNSLGLDNTLARLLDELPRLKREDLEDFLDTHNIRLPSRKRARIVDSVLAKGEGDYERTLALLEELQSRAWDMEDDEPEQPAPVATDDIF